jgi:oxygen-independent coproporphyrinogen-3 oxidase
LYSQQGVDAVYVHIPFCPHKCFYCDFNSYVVESEDPVWKYIYALEREMEWTVEQFPPGEIKTIFIGGGTPTALSPAQMEVLFRSLDKHFGKRHANVEMTMEANPGTLDRDKLQMMRAGGVNRISLGAQTFNEKLLTEIGRIHTVDDVARSIELARQEHFHNLSIDLMFGLPGQTLDMVRDAVVRALAFDLPHVSLYGLKIEENTLFHTLYMRNQLVLPDEDAEVDMYRLIIEKMECAGYAQYEISNFAKDGFESKHNIMYWKNRGYYGLGAGAHGYFNGMRHVNVKGVQPYIDACAQGLPRLETHEVKRGEAMEDFMMVGLRIMNGIRRTDFFAQFGCDWDELFLPLFQELCAKGLLEATADGYKLTKSGLFVGNEVFGRFVGALSDL